VQEQAKQETMSEQIQVRKLDREISIHKKDQAEQRDGFSLTKNLKKMNEDDQEVNNEVKEDQVMTEEDNTKNDHN